MSYFINEKKGFSFPGEYEIKKSAIEKFCERFPQYKNKIYFISYLLADGNILIKLDNVNKNAIIDYNGGLLLGFHYEVLACGENGFFKVSRNNLIGYLNESYQLVIPIIFQSGSNFKNGTAQVVREGEKFFIDEEGLKLKYAYNEA